MKDLIKAEEARRILGVSSVKMAQLIKHGVLKHYRDPLDARVKLVRRDDVEALKNRVEEAA